VAEKILHSEHTWEIPDVIAEGDYYGMQTFDQALVELVRSGLIDPADAAIAASQPHDFELKLRAEQLA
jgi:twitching motility protein PilT